MPRRPLPDASEVSAILAARRSRPPKRPPPRVGRSLTGFIKALDDRFGKGVDGLKSRWREIAGEGLAARTEPVKLVKGRAGGPSTLEIRVDGPAAALIQHQAPQILQRVRMFLGEGAVDRLRIIQGPVRASAWRGAEAVQAVKSRRAKAPPLDAAEEARLQQGLAAAPEGPLRAALLRLGREVLRERR